MLHKSRDGYWFIVALSNEDVGRSSVKQDSDTKVIILYYETTYLIISLVLLLLTFAASTK